MLITPRAWWWFFQRYHVRAELSAADNNAASTNALYYRLCILYVRGVFLYAGSDMKLNYGRLPEFALLLLLDIKKCKGMRELYLMISRKDVAISAIKEPWSSPPLRVGVLMWAHRCRQNLSFAHLGHWAPSSGRGPCTGWKEPSLFWLWANQTARTGGSHNRGCWSADAWNGKKKNKQKKAPASLLRSRSPVGLTRVPHFSR